MDQLTPNALPPCRETELQQHRSLQAPQVAGDWVVTGPGEKGDFGGKKTW